MAAKRKEGPLIKTVGVVFFISLGLALTIIITSWIARSGAHQEPLFWAIAVVEVAIAFLVYRIPYRLRALVFLTAFWLPLLLAAFIESLWPFTHGAVVFFMAGVNA